MTRYAPKPTGSVSHCFDTVRYGSQECLIFLSYHAIRIPGTEGHLCPPSDRIVSLLFLEMVRDTVVLPGSAPPLLRYYQLPIACSSPVNRLFSNQPGSLLSSTRSLPEQPGGVVPFATFFYYGIPSRIVDPKNPPTLPPARAYCSEYSSRLRSMALKNSARLRLASRDCLAKFPMFSWSVHRRRLICFDCFSYAGRRVEKSARIARDATLRPIMGTASPRSPTHCRETCTMKGKTHVTPRGT